MQKKVGARRTGGKRAVLGKKERRRLIQLVVCLGLFLVVFFGKGRLPDEMLDSLQANTDFKAAFSALGKALSDRKSVTEVFGALVTGSLDDGQEHVQAEYPLPAGSSAALVMERIPDRDMILARLGIEAGPEPENDSRDADAEASAPLPEQTAEYTGPALPEGATMDYQDLGIPDHVTPVTGELTSAYGYRDHPVNGTYAFHSGVDLAANLGTPVAAFASGTVDYVGESEAYGLYIQLRHENDVTTFYCHCSELCARKGERVSVGQTIAKVGDTGNATGAHLHLEIKKNGVQLNPAYYIEIPS